VRETKRKDGSLLRLLNVSWTAHIADYRTIVEQEGKSSGSMSFFFGSLFFGRNGALFSKALDSI
jgi:hypothetical protein